MDRLRDDENPCLILVLNHVFLGLMHAFQRVYGWT
jgi:hypothetical protein